MDGVRAVQPHINARAKGWPRSEMAGGEKGQWGKEVKGGERQLESM